MQQSPRVRQAIKLLEMWLDAQRDNEQIPGLSAAVVHEQEVARMLWHEGEVEMRDGRVRAARFGGSP